MAAAVYGSIFSCTVRQAAASAELMDEAGAGGTLGRRLRLTSE